MQNLVQKFRQSSTVFEKPGKYFAWKIENFYELQQTQKFIYFFAEILHTIHTYQCLQKVSSGFLVYLDLDLD